jgi:hypothetical protein
LRLWEVFENSVQVVDFEWDMHVWSVLNQRGFMGLERFEYLEHFFSGYNNEAVFKRLGSSGSIAMCKDDLNSPGKLVC